MAAPVADPWGGGDGGNPPNLRVRKIFLNVSENKSSDRKLSLTFVSSAFYVEYPFRRFFFGGGTF